MNSDTYITESFKYQYEEAQAINEYISTPLNADSSLITELEQLYEIIVQEYPLTSFQIRELRAIINKFVYIQETIDPNRIKPFKHDYNKAEELLILYRKSAKGLFNILIDEDELVTFSYIDSTPEEKDIHDMYDGEPVDYEKVVLNFLI